MSDIFYCIECDYQSRSKEKTFLKDVLNSFAKDEITGFNLYVNNNPYSLQFHLGVFFNSDETRNKFGIWLKEKYPNKKIKPNMKFVELVRSANVCGLCDSDSIDIVVTNNANHMFIFPEKSILENNYPQFSPVQKNKPRIFLSHSSLDKDSIVEPMYEYLQSRQISVWLDKYEIDYGDNIYQKVSEGIDDSEFAIFVITENFLNSKWAKEELSSMINLVFNDNSLVVIDVKDKTNIPRMISSRKYMEWNNGNCLDEVVSLLNRKLKL